MVTHPAINRRRWRVLAALAGLVLVITAAALQGRGDQDVDGAESAESKAVEVFAPAGTWTAPREISCDGLIQSTTIDFVAGSEPDLSRLTDPVEPVVRADPHMGPWLHEDDELLTTGYVESPGRRVEVVRSGVVIAEVNLLLGDHGWVISGWRRCDNP